MAKTYFAKLCQILLRFFKQFAFIVLQPVQKIVASDNVKSMIIPYFLLCHISSGNRLTMEGGDRAEEPIGLCLQNRKNDAILNTIFKDGKLGIKMNKIIYTERRKEEINVA